MTTSSELPEAVQNPVHSRCKMRCSGPPHLGARHPKKRRKPGPSLAFRVTVRHRAKVCKVLQYPQGDSKEPRIPAGKPGSDRPGGTDSGTLADAGNLDKLATALLALSPDERARLAALLVAGAAADAAKRP